MKYKDFILYPFHLSVSFLASCRKGLTGDELPRTEKGDRVLFAWVVTYE
jgi:hypothetical protein